MSLTSSGCRMIFDSVPYIDPVSHIRRRSVLGARSSVTSPTASSPGGRYSSTLLAASACDGGACSTPIPLAVSARSDDRSTSTPLAASARGGDCSASTPPVAFTCGSTSTRHSRSTIHAAFTGGGDCSSSACVSTSTSSVVSLSAREIAQLRCLLAAWDSSPTSSAGSMTDSALRNHLLHIQD